MLPTLVQTAGSLLPESFDHAVVFVSAFMIAYIYYNGSKRLQRTTTQSFRHPPSLGSLPLVGSIFYLPGFRDMHTFFLEKLPTLGPVISFKLMSRKNVILQTREAILEAFVKPEVSNRPSNMFLDEFFGRPKKGIFEGMYTAEFKRYHQLTLSILKQFGFGTLGGVMEARIQGEVAEMIAEFKATGSKPTEPLDTVEVIVINVIASILFGKRFEKDDPLVWDFIGRTSQLVRSGVRLIPLAFIPILRYIPYYRQTMNDTKELFTWYDEQMQKKIDECTQDEAETPCFIRSFIEAEGRETYDNEQLVRTLQDLVMAGSESSATTIEWSMILLANHQEIQTRLHAELDSVVPRDRLPSLDDRPLLTFVEAFTMEMMRYKTIARLGFAHETSTDVVIQGFKIPANTVVISNLHAVHMDPNVWGDPEIFRPDRFIDDDGNIVNRQKLIPFSIGKRACLGELLARQEIFLFIAGLLQNFTILPPEGCSTVEYEEIIGSTYRPSAFKVRFVPRELVTSNSSPI